MKICHVCGVECADEQEICLICGADLSENTVIEQEENGDNSVMTEPVLIATFEDVVLAEIFKDILTDNQIPYSMGEEGGAVRVTFGGGFTADEVYVDKRDFNKAEALYNELMENQPEFSDDDFFIEEEN